MSLITWNGLKPPPSENVSNSYSGVRYLFREIWNHLPVWLGVFNLLSMAFMAMAFFTPSRTVYVLAAGFPLFWTTLYFYARFSTDAVRTKTAGIRTLKIILACLALLLVIAGFVRPMVGNNVVTPLPISIQAPRFNSMQPIQSWVVTETRSWMQRALRCSKAGR